MKTNPIALLLLLPALLISACQLPQAEASATYVGAEVAAATLLQKNPSLLPVMQLLTQDWVKYQGGTLTSTDEAKLLQQIVSATKATLTPTQAALLDGATQQLLANTNASAPTPLGGAAAAIITDLMSGVAREIVVYTTPAS